MRLLVFFLFFFFTRFSLILFYLLENNINCTEPQKKTRQNKRYGRVYRCVVHRHHMIAFRRLQPVGIQFQCFIKHYSHDVCVCLCGTCGNDQFIQNGITFQQHSHWDCIVYMCMWLGVDIHTKTNLHIHKIFIVIP